MDVQRTIKTVHLDSNMGNFSPDQILQKATSVINAAQKKFLQDTKGDILSNCRMFNCRVEDPESKKLKSVVINRTVHRTLSRGNGMDGAKESGNFNN